MSFIFSFNRKMGIIVLGEWGMEKQQKFNITKKVKNVATRVINNVLFSCITVEPIKVRSFKRRVWSVEWKRAEGRASGG
jgi:hypothetical protein